MIRHTHTLTDAWCLDVFTRSQRTSKQCDAHIPVCASGTLSNDKIMEWMTHPATASSIRWIIRVHTACVCLCVPIWRILVNSVHHTRLTINYLYFRTFRRAICPSSLTSRQNIVRHQIMPRACVCMRTKTRRRESIVICGWHRSTNERRLTRTHKSFVRSLMQCKLIRTHTNCILTSGLFSFDRAEHSQTPLPHGNDNRSVCVFVWEECLVSNLCLLFPTTLRIESTEWNAFRVSNEHVFHCLTYTTDRLQVVIGEWMFVSAR